MDLSTTIAPRSDQLNGEDLLAGPVDVTITGVSAGNREQPVNIYLAEFGDGRPFKPCKTVRRILVNAWGPDGQQYVGRRMRLFRDPKVKFGGEDTGGIRVSHLSHIGSRLEIPLTVTRGKRAKFIVEPLPDTPAQQSSAGPDFDRIDAMIREATDDDQLRDFWSKLSAMEGERAAASRDLVVARRTELQQQQDTPADGQTTLAEIESEDQA